MEGEGRGRGGEDGRREGKGRGGWREERREDTTDHM